VRVADAVNARRLQALAHAEDARFPPPDDLAYLCHGRRPGDAAAAAVAVAPVGGARIETRDTARKKKEKAKRDEERRIKQTQHTRDIRSLLVRVKRVGGGRTR
jgi:hypothetical protein